MSALQAKIFPLKFPQKAAFVHPFHGAFSSFEFFFTHLGLYALAGIREFYILNRSHRNCALCL